MGQRICRSEHLDGIKNSARFRSYQKDYISKIYEDGVVENIFSWPDEGYGIVIQTTGWNIREAKVIAELPVEKYCRKKY